MSFGAAGANGIKMSFETVIYEKKEHVAIITMNRPDALNALSEKLVDELPQAINKAVEEGARAIVLTGAGRAFCAGGDLREMKQIAEKEGRIEAFFEEPLRKLHECILLIRNTPVPFIAAVNGICAGAGTNIALACDMIYAADIASFNQGFVKIGLTPDCGGTFFLPHAVGEKMAAEILMTGESISADRAVKMGMINKAVGPDYLMSEVVALAGKIAMAPTAAIGRIKGLINSSFSNDLRAQLDAEHKSQIESGKSEDFKEGVTAFFEKRAPQFSGH
jgi:2-(1,2-epoxy-1,2-dihydrophenyl)acetyl-CoA isomerase